MAAGQLGQARPSNTTATSIYSPVGTGTVVTSMQMFVCNTTVSAASFRIFQDNDGSTFDEDTAIVWDQSLAGRDTVIISLGPMDNPAGNVGVRTDAGNALTFTLYGTEGT